MVRCRILQLENTQLVLAKRPQGQEIQGILLWQIGKICPAGFEGEVANSRRRYLKDIAIPADPEEGLVPTSADNQERVVLPIITGLNGRHREFGLGQDGVGGNINQPDGSFCPWLSLQFPGTSIVKGDRRHCLCGQWINSLRMAVFDQGGPDLPR